MTLIETSTSWVPRTWIGAPAPGGLALPAAQPTGSHLYAPRGVWLDDGLLVVADSGNHRVMVWHGVPDEDEAPADVVLGQPDATSEGPGAAGRGPERGMHLPCGVFVHDGRLVVCDSWHHRILIWDDVPRSSDVAPDVILGQVDASSTLENRGAGTSATGLYWPYGAAVVDGWFWVADTGNRRVLGWDGLPGPDDEPDVVLGQPDADGRDENRGGEAAADSFRWPHDIAGDADRLLVADAGNHRALGWAPRPDRDGPAGWAMGQNDLTTATEFPYAPQTAAGFRFPYAIDLDGDHLVVADTANNRVLWWEGIPQRTGAPADGVLGQPDLTANGENRWDRVDRDTLCWPYGISLHGARLAVADSGNNRVMVWERR
ncbi:MAG: NHL repeat-containing protein [Actinomycetota bacterium]